MIRPTPRMLDVLAEMDRTGCALITTATRGGDWTYTLDGRYVFPPTASGLTWRGLVKTREPAARTERGDLRWVRYITDEGRAALTPPATALAARRTR